LVDDDDDDDPVDAGDTNQSLPSDRSGEITTATKEEEATAEDEQQSERRKRQRLDSPVNE